ncbi:MAG: hypothetical protein IJG02_09870, partial [Thermoguttaceae bacterium]|nr:hypothetical protein [Thermoguttaceae bacterium]
ETLEAMDSSPASKRSTVVKGKGVLLKKEVQCEVSFRQKHFSSAACVSLSECSPNSGAMVSKKHRSCFF